MIAGNREGFNFREQLRTTRTIEDRTERPVWNHGEVIRHNLIVLNCDAQVWGWFAVDDNRHWPVRGAPQPPDATAKPGDIAGAYVAKAGAGQPQGLTLEKLNLQFENNVYFAAPGRSWFKWGPSWTRHRNYTGLREFQSDLGIDAGSQELDPAFADLRQLDLRLRPETLSRLKASYPQSPVPGVILSDVSTVP